MKTILKVALGIIVAFALLVGGCTALIGTAANDVQKESDKSAITKAEFDSVKNGTTREAVEKKLGEPTDVQETEIDTSSFEGSGASSSHDCIYYNKKGEVISAYQLCFEDGKLSSKSSY